MPRNFENPPKWLEEREQMKKILHDFMVEYGVSPAGKYGFISIIIAIARYLQTSIALHSRKRAAFSIFIANNDFRHSSP